MQSRPTFFFLSLILLVFAAACGGAPETGTPAERGTAQAPEAPAAAESPAAPQTPQAPQPPAAPQAPAAPAPRPAPAAPKPEPVHLTVPAGTQVEIEFLEPLSSATSQPGDSFRARVVGDVVRDGQVVIPAGSVVYGTVTEAVPLKKKIGGRAKLGVDFTKLELPDGQMADIEATFAELGKSETKKDAATIGGAAAGGALLGRLLKRDDEAKGTLIGAIVGAAAGTAIAAKTEGEEVTIPAGTVVTIELNSAVTVHKVR